VRAIYTAASRSLAVLEILVNYAILPADFAMTTVRIPTRVKIGELPRSLLAPGWQDTPTITQILGKMWLARASVLCVRSAVPFRFDSRLK
jgi:hypothetical protein